MCGAYWVAGGHALLSLEPAEAPFHRVARLVSFRVVGLGFGRRRRAGRTALMPRGASHARKASPSQARSAIRQVRGVPVQASTQARAWCGRGAGRPSGAATRGVPVDRPGCGSGCGSRPGCDRGRDPALFGGAPAACAPDRAVQQRRGQLRFVLQVGHPARPDALIAPVGQAAIDRVPCESPPSKTSIARHAGCSRAIRINFCKSSLRAG